MPASPALAAAYAGWRAPAARMPTIEVMFTMDPPSCSSMTGIAALQSMNGAVRFTAIVSSYCSRLVSMMSPQPVTAALLTRMSTRPNAPTAWSTMTWPMLGSTRSATTIVPVPPSSSITASVSAAAFLDLVDEDELHALAREQHRDGLADAEARTARPGPGDDRDLAFQFPLLVHCEFLRWRGPNEPPRVARTGGRRPSRARGRVRGSRRRSRCRAPRSRARA